MRLASSFLGALSISLLPALAGAQPVTAPDRCEVRIARAPDDVREVIESWVRAEPRCAVALEVRVVPTEGGYYLYVRDRQGRERERIVPDAQSAGVLVASWAADDGIVPESGPAAAPLAPLGPELPPEAPPSHAPVAPAPARVAAAPGLTPPHAAPAGVVAAAAPPARPTRWLTLAAMTGMPDTNVETGGVRAELDLRTRGRWVLGVGASIQYANAGLYDAAGSGYIEATDLRALATLGYNTSRGRWQLRLSAGLGVMFTTATGWFDNYQIDARGTSPTGEVSALVARDLTRRWSVTAGLVITATHQEYIAPGPGPMVVLVRDTETSGFLGVRRRY